MSFTRFYPVNFDHEISVSEWSRPGNLQVTEDIWRFMLGNKVASTISIVMECAVRADLDSLIALIAVLKNGEYHDFRSLQNQLSNVVYMAPTAKYKEEIDWGIHDLMLPYKKRSGERFVLSEIIAIALSSSFIKSDSNDGIWEYKPRKSMNFEDGDVVHYSNKNNVYPKILKLLNDSVALYKEYDELIVLIHSITPYLHISGFLKDLVESGCSLISLMQTKLSIKGSMDDYTFLELCFLTRNFYFANELLDMVYAARNSGGHDLKFINGNEIKFIGEIDVNPSEIGEEVFKFLKIINSYIDSNKGKDENFIYSFQLFLDQSFELITKIDSGDLFLSLMRQDSLGCAAGSTLEKIFRLENKTGKVVSTWVNIVGNYLVLFDASSNGFNEGFSTGIMRIADSIRYIDPQDLWPTLRTVSEGPEVCLWLEIVLRSHAWPVLDVISTVLPKLLNRQETKWHVETSLSKPDAEFNCLAKFVIWNTLFSEESMVKTLKIMADANQKAIGNFMLVDLLGFKQVKEIWLKKREVEKTADAEKVQSNEETSLLHLLARNPVSMYSGNSSVKIQVMVIAAKVGVPVEILDSAGKQAAFNLKDKDLRSQWDGCARSILAENESNKIFKELGLSVNCSAHQNSLF